MKRSDAPPTSVTNMTINGIALLAALLMSWWLVASGTGISGLVAVLLIAASYTLPIVVLEALWIERGHLRPRSSRRGGCW